MLPEQLHRRAIARQKRLVQMGAGEDAALAALEEVGLKIEQQFPVGGYNLDLAIPASRIAVEVQGNSFDRNAPGEAAKRIKYIVDAGWRIIYVIQFGRREPTWRVIAEKIHALCKRLRRDKSKLGQYGMILGDGTPSAALSGQLVDVPRIPGF